MQLNKDVKIYSVFLRTFNVFLYEGNDGFSGKAENNLVEIPSLQKVSCKTLTCKIFFAVSKPVCYLEVRKRTTHNRNFFKEKLWNAVCVLRVYWSRRYHKWEEGWVILRALSRQWAQWHTPRTQCPGCVLLIWGTKFLLGWSATTYLRSGKELKRVINEALKE